MKHFHTRFESELLRALKPFGLNEKVCETFKAHWELVQSWNKRTNLTAVTNDREAAWLHYRDSLEAICVIPHGSLVDFGSGAGFPGIPIAIFQPDRPVTLVESRRKKASFLQTAVARLGLENVSILNARVEERPTQEYCVGVTRATFSKPKDRISCARWIKRGGALVVFSSEPNDPNAEMSHHYEVMGISRWLHMYSCD